MINFSLGEIHLLIFKNGLKKPRCMEINSFPFYLLGIRMI